MPVRMSVADTEYLEKDLGSKHKGEPLIEGVELPDVYIRSMYFGKVGESNIPHKHLYPHYTLLASGSCLADLDGIRTKYVAPCIIFTPAMAMHSFTALEPDTALHCINILHNGEPVIV